MKASGIKRGDLMARPRDYLKACATGRVTPMGLTMELSTERSLADLRARLKLRALMLVTCLATHWDYLICSAGMKVLQKGKTTDSSMECSLADSRARAKWRALMLAMCLATHWD